MGRKNVDEEKEINQTCQKKLAGQSSDGLWQ